MVPRRSCGRRSCGVAGPDVDAGDAFVLRIQRQGPWFGIGRPASERLTNQLFWGGTGARGFEGLSEAHRRRASALAVIGT